MAAGMTFDEYEPMLLVMAVEHGHHHLSSEAC